MEKDILIENLKAKVGEDNCKSISDRTFEGIANVYLPMFADDSKITDETWKLPVTTLVEFAGQKRFDEKNFAEKFKNEYTTQHEKDVAERIRLATEKAVEDYKKAHPEKKVEEEDGIEEKINAAVADALGKLTGEESDFGKLNKTLSAFIKSQTEREKTEKKNSVRNELKKHLLELKANNEACVDDALDDIEYGDAPTFDGLKQAAISAYEKRYKRYYADGGKPFGGDGAGGGDKKDLYDSYIQRLTDKQKDNKDYADSIVFAK